MKIRTHEVSGSALEKAVEDLGGEPVWVYSCVNNIAYNRSFSDVAGEARLEYKDGELVLDVKLFVTPAGKNLKALMSIRSLGFSIGGKVLRRNEDGEIVEFKLESVEVVK